MMASATRDQAPLATIERGRDGEQLRVTLSEYHGTTYVDIRVWWRKSDGAWAPSRKGVTFDLDSVDVIVTALEKAKRQREAHGR